MLQAKTALEVEVAQHVDNASKLQMRLEKSRQAFAMLQQKESRIASQVSVLMRQAQGKDEDMLRLQNLMQQVWPTSSCITCTVPRLPETNYMLVACHFWHTQKYKSASSPISFCLKGPGVSMHAWLLHAKGGCGLHVLRSVMSFCV